MKITPRTEHHPEVTGPAVWATTGTEKLIDLMIELPDHMIDLTVGEARRLRDELNAALSKELHASAVTESQSNRPPDPMENTELVSPAAEPSASEEFIVTHLNLISAQIERNTADLKVFVAEMELKNAEDRLNQPQL